MNVLWILIGLGFLFVILRCWDGFDDAIDDDAPAVVMETAPGPEVGNGSGVEEPWPVRLALIVCGLAIAFAIEIGPLLLLDALL